MILNKNWFQLQPLYKNLQKQVEKEKTLKYLEIGGTFTLIAIFIFFAIMPTMTTISALLGEIKSKETFINKVNQKITNILKAQDAYAQVQEKYLLIEESFPSQPQYYNSATNLATLFRDSSLAINQINFNLNDDKNTPKESSNSGRSLQSYQVSLTGEGPYSAVMEVVKALFNNRRLINTSGIQINQITTNDNPTGSDNIKINISNDLYFLPTTQ